MCRYCYKTKETDQLYTGLDVHQSWYDCNHSFKEHEKNLLKFMEAAKNKEIRKEISAHHKKIVNIRKSFNRIYGKFLTGEQSMALEGK